MGSFCTESLIHCANDCGRHTVHANGTSQPPKDVAILVAAKGDVRQHALKSVPTWFSWYISPSVADADDDVCSGLRLLEVTGDGPVALALVIEATALVLLSPLPGVATSDAVADVVGPSTLASPRCCIALSCI